MFPSQRKRGVVYLDELISLAHSLFQLFLLVLQDRTRVFLPLEFLKRQEFKKIKTSFGNATKIEWLRSRNFFASSWQDEFHL